MARFHDRAGLQPFRSAVGDIYPAFDAVPASLKLAQPLTIPKQYRNTVLKPANIVIDVDHDLPPDIEALLLEDLRDIFDRPRLAPPTDNRTHGGTRSEDNTNECRELARKTGSEPEYRTHLYGDVVEKLARVQPWRRSLSASCSDKFWLASLKKMVQEIACTASVHDDQSVTVADTRSKPQAKHKQSLVATSFLRKVPVAG
ncbi:hypothetical protein PSPO01_04901 [Paraphaeosphaeria sporulosa]